jgi:hypothetical protein
LNSMLKEVDQLKKKTALDKRVQNRTELVDYMNTLNIGNTDKQKILKNYDSQKANLGTLKNRATQVNAVIKNRQQQRQELSNYINSLGINGTQLLAKLNDGRSTLNRLKVDANKMKSVANASLVNSKRDQLRVHMKNSRLDDINKKSFINRVTLNTNMNSIKGEVNTLNTQLKTRNEQLAAKKLEVSLFLNTLNDLRPENRKAFLAKVTTANTNIDGIILDAMGMNKGVKNRRVEKERKEEDEKKKKELKVRKVDEERLSKHLKSLKHLTSAEMNEYMSSFLKNGAKYENLITSSKAKDVDNEKDKDTLRIYIRNAKIPVDRKQAYLKQLSQPYVNTRPIKKLVNVDKEQERMIGEGIKIEVMKKLKSFKDITADERAKFINSLKNKTSKNVLEAADKLDTERKDARKTRDTGIKNVANELSKLTTIERDNRKKLMNRLSTNGAEKVLANARQLNRERKITKKQPLLNKVAREITGTLGIWRRGWEDAIRKATTLEELQRLDSLLDQKIILRQEIENASISEDKRRGQIRFVMKMTNDVDLRKQELAKNIQSMNKVRFAKRKNILNEISKHTNKRITNIKSRAANPFKTEAELNTISRDVKEMVKLVASEKNTRMKISNNPLFEPETTAQRMKRAGENIKRVQLERQQLFRTSVNKVVQNNRMKTMTNAVKKASEVETKKQNISTMTGPMRVEASRNLASNQGRNRGQTAMNLKKIFSTGQSETERLRVAGQKAEEKRKAKSELRIKNKQLAKVTGQGVKATQKRQQALRRR